MIENVKFPNDRTMYVPAHFAHDDRADLFSVMRQNNFATIVSNLEGAPFATHAPLLVRENEAGDVIIEGHVAAANPHALALGGATVLVVFHGPHAYISPTSYRSANRVPTWNYIAVHASGRARTINDAAGKMAILSHLIEFHEPGFAPRLAEFDPGFRDSLVAAIVGFEIEVDKLEGKFKLGQNRLSDNLPALQAAHEAGGENQRALAAWMKKLGYWS